MKNYMEILVDEIFEEMKPDLKNTPKDQCDCLIKDIKSMALNNLEPKYFLSTTSEADRMAFLLNKTNRMTVTVKIAEAFRVLCNS